MYFNSEPILARLAAFAAPAEKTRIIYVLNWWVQGLLLPLHDSMMNYFRVIGNDAIWNQDKAVEALKQWSAEGRDLYSFDFSAATDKKSIRNMLLPQH